MKDDTAPHHAGSQHIPAPLRDWLDQAILSTVADSTSNQASAGRPKSAILKTMLQPLKPGNSQNTAAH